MRSVQARGDAPSQRALLKLTFMSVYANWKLHTSSEDLYFCSTDAIALLFQKGKTSALMMKTIIYICKLTTAMSYPIHRADAEEAVLSSALEDRHSSM